MLLLFFIHIFKERYLSFNIYLSKVLLYFTFRHTGCFNFNKFRTYIIPVLDNSLDDVFIIYLNTHHYLNIT